ncbi:MAG: hypothetical protein JW913_15180 [Chitinispirillaceae bacterium]|nr:hypothetical protein [Chitinispirillaceae bacterium]
MLHLPFFQNKSADGLTTIEVVIAVFIFSCVSAAIFNFIGQIDRTRVRTVFIANASRLAAGEAERLRSIAARNAPVEDSSYTETVSGRTFRVKRDCIEDDMPPSFLPIAREPLKIELCISDENNEDVKPLRFKLLLGQDNP